MKSDQEFLEGIYKKASEYKRPARFRAAVSYAAVLIIGAVGLTVVLSGHMKLGRNDILENQSLIRDVRMPFGIGMDNPDAGMQEAVKEEAGKADIVLLGTIREISRIDYGTAGLLDVISSYKGEYQQDSILIESIFPYQEDGGFYHTVQGSKVLVFLTVTDGNYLLSGEEKGLFLYEGMPGEGYFIRQDGIRIFEKEITEELF